MPGIPLLNIGTALGGLAGGYNQARSQGLQQAIQQLALQQQQGLSNQQTLAGLALQAGLLNQPGGGQTSLGGQSFSSPQQPPNVNIANITPPASGSGGGAPPGYAPPLSPSGPPAPGDMTSADEVQLNADAGQDQFGATNQAITAAGFGNQTASSGGSDATPAPTPTPTPTPSPASSSDSGSGSGGVGMQFGNGPPIDMSTMFQRLDYQKLAQGIAQIAPPGTSQADIYGAVVDLAKLADGDKTQQQQAAYMLKLLGIQGRMVEIGQQGQIKSGQIAQQGDIRSGQIAQQGDIRSRQIAQQDATKMAIANQSAQIRRDALTADTTAKWAQIVQKNQQLAQQLNIAGDREAAQAINQQLRALQARIAAINAMAAGSGGKLNKNQQAELQQINDNIASIGAKVGAQQGAGP